ncbi:MULTISPECIES: L,D-transpeptidase [unclassified Bifidobacterium]|uniref:L,D-transpeptidase n=1 Tax=unclassified Bifidobacterium TaxID=2608897 RepID=UPI001D885A74|nr:MULTISPECIES: L,D-transpeptidase [unclassified Bifidobacterium]TPF77918.1 hypothetical protein BW09_07265 [Bifidobacterium sp. UTCIF-1]TPF79556.1 hypothetical protein BW08_09390 [Bifidobacterium sp. UTCIF-24]TPF88073.1 hypothetical protein BW10_10500 [Bifidobacterium sp. UTBIF-56]
MMMGFTGNVSGRHIKNRDNSAALVRNTSVGVVGLMLVLAIGAGTMNMNNVTAEAEDASIPMVVDKPAKAVPLPASVAKTNAPAPNAKIIAEREAQAKAAEEAKKQAEAAKLQEEQARQQAEQAKLQAEQAANNAAWMNPTGSQPNLADYPNLSVHVSLAEQQVHVMSNGQDIYVMKASTGVDDATPHGRYYINGLRGDSFYNPNEQMGARDWVGFIGGTYLFHSVPTDANGNWIVSEAEKLGQPASHGCVRLTVADAAWFRQQIPTGTPIDIG